MKYEVSDRGFKHMDEVTCKYGSHVRVYESSAAMSPHIWLKIEQGAEPTSQLDESEAVAHLSIEQAESVRDQLDFLIHNHYQVQ